MRVSLEPANQPEAIALIADLDAYQDTLYPPEARYALDLHSLTQPNVLFALARTTEGKAIGCGALVLNSGYGEIKRMFVRPEVRGSAAAREIIHILETNAYAQGCRKCLLETGPHQSAALAFYSRQGYTRCGAFGAYPEHPLSVFMVKLLEPAAANLK